MTHAVDAGLALSLVSSVFYILLGAWVFTLTPRRRQTTLLGAFAVLFGLSFVLWDLSVIVHGDRAPFTTAGIQPLGFLGELAQGLASLTVLALAAYVPRRLEDRRPLVTAVGLGLAFSAVWAGSFIDLPISSAGWRWYLSFGMLSVRAGSFWAAVVLLALRAAPSRDPSVGETTQIAMLAVAFAFFWEFVSGVNVPALAADLARGASRDVVADSAVLGFWLTAAGLWGRNMLQADEVTVRIHRVPMLAILGLLAAGALASAVVLEATANPTIRGLAPILGVARTIGVGLLAYGVLRHDLAGLDEKVEFGVSRTTVAGIFVAVFFVVSEGAQVLFAGFAGSKFLGVLAAGALVFFLAPIQRMADELAARAVPGGAEPGADAEARYRREVQAALADDELTREEERHLARRADELGIGTERALDLREQAGDEADGGEAA